MSVPRPSGGGVRSLRAMFENPEAGSPEPRGRSPAASITSDTSLSRQTSKIRASFVSVEPSGFTPRDLSGPRGDASPAAHRRESFSLRRSRDSEALKELHETMSQELEERKNSLPPSEVVPEEAIDTAATPGVEKMEQLGEVQGVQEEADTLPVKPKGGPAKIAAVQESAEHAAAARESASNSVLETQALDTELAGDNKKSLEADQSNQVEGAEETTANSDKPISSTEETPAVMRPSDPTDKAAVSGGDALPAPQESLPSLTDSSEPTPKKTSSEKTDNVDGAGSSILEGAPQPAASPANGHSTIADARAALKPTSVSKPPAISTAKAAAAPKPAVKSANAAKSPIVKTPTSASAKAAPKLAASTKPPSKATEPSKASKRTSIVSAPASAPKDRLASSTSSSSFAKPKPRSPTRPVNLPSHLTAPTAASAAKHDTAGVSGPATRKPVAPARDRTSVMKPATSVKKQSSRASLPPQPVNRPESRTSTAAPDSGFLARMMRPTASSANKAHEKVEVRSPPRGKPAAKSRASVGPGFAAKTKAKLAEGVEKVKDKVASNGPGTEEEETSNSADALPKTDATEEYPKSESQHDATPDVTSTDLAAETPNFEGATIR